MASPNKEHVIITIIVIMTLNVLVKFELIALGTSHKGVVFDYSPFMENTLESIELSSSMPQ